MIRLPLRDRPRPIIVTPELRAVWRTYEYANDKAHRQYLASPIACGSGRGTPMMLCRKCRVNRCLGDVCAPCKAVA